MVVDADNVDCCEQMSHECPMDRERLGFGMNPQGAPESTEQVGPRGSLLWKFEVPRSCNAKCGTQNRSNPFILGRIDGRIVELQTTT